MKSAVRKTHRYTPDINLAYQQMAAHYQLAIVPARPYKPKDKSKAEVGVQIVERWILARLRHQTFFTLGSLNQAIRHLLTELNQKPFKKLPGCRQSQFEQIDQPALKPLPTHSYEYKEIKQATVHVDYHIEYDKHYYSVPHHWVKQKVEVQASATMVSIYAHNQRIACHPRSLRQGGHSTCIAHMPQHHRSYHEWSPERFLKWAGDIGQATHQVVEYLLQLKYHKEQSYRCILGLLSLAKPYSRERLNKACERALAFGKPNRRSIEAILKQGLDQLPLEQDQEDLFLDDHENLRGDSYYH